MQLELRTTVQELRGHWQFLHSGETELMLQGADAQEPGWPGRRSLLGVSLKYSHEDVMKVCTDICVQFEPKLW